jgi:hypothetical protein
MTTWSPHRWRVPPNMKLTEAREWDEFSAECQSCGHAAVLPPWLVAKKTRLRSNDLRDFEARLRCSRCKSRNCTLMVEALSRNV